MASGFFQIDAQITNIQNKQGTGIKIETTHTPFLSPGQSDECWYILRYNKATIIGKRIDLVKLTFKKKTTIKTRQYHF